MKGLCRAFYASCIVILASEVHGKLGWNTAGRGDPYWPQGCSTPYDITLSMQSGGEKRNKAGTFGTMTFVFPSQCYLWWSLAFLSVTCLPMGSSKFTPCFALLKCKAHAFPIQPSPFQAMSFLTFMILFLIPLVGEWVSDSVGLSCWFRPWQHESCHQNWQNKLSHPFVRLESWPYSKLEYVGITPQNM